VNAPDINNQAVAKAYARWAPVYDVVFGRIFSRGRAASIEAAERIGGRILDVGVGTGISLLEYKRTNRISAVDYSEPMLKKARERVLENKLDNVECVAVMDAQSLGFADNVFDAVVAQYVITTVPEPRSRAR
jgi:phosphatidylethanolamine/phosphatidyl-N-methylethanolamine N-methyltransferase